MRILAITLLLLGSVVSNADNQMINKFTMKVFCNNGVGTGWTLAGAETVVPKNKTVASQLIQNFTNTNCMGAESVELSCMGSAFLSGDFETSLTVYKVKSCHVSAIER